MTSCWITARGVKLARVGDWPTYRGDGTLTRADLADIVDAANDDTIRAALDGDPVGWLGHDEDDVSAAVRQSEPSIGRVTNLRLADEGDTLVGDLEDIPEVVSRTYGRRSVELQPNVRGTGGRTYRRVLTGLAYLGCKRGAITGLGDLTALLDGRETPVLASHGEPVLMAIADDPHDPATDDLSHLDPVQARQLGYLPNITDEQARRSFYGIAHGANVVRDQVTRQRRAKDR